MPVVNFSAFQAGQEWSTGKEQQQLSVILMRGALSCLLLIPLLLPSPFCRLPLSAFRFLLPSALSGSSAECLPTLCVFQQLVSLPFATEVPAVLPLLFRWLKAHKRPLRAGVKYPLILQYLSFYRKPHSLEVRLNTVLRFFQSPQHQPPGTTPFHFSGA